MEIVRDGQKINYDRTVIALGNFDGLHTAHMKIIRKCVSYAKENNAKSGIMLLENSIKNVKNITSEREKIRILECEKPDFVYLKSFTEAFMKKTPEEFVSMLKKEFHAIAVCVGYDYKFGYKAKGNVAMLCEFGKQMDFEVIVMPMISIDNCAVHSTGIRRFIKEGDISSANRLLGRNFSVCGEVVKGLQNGRKIGIPTANVDNSDVILPKDGVYAGITYINDEPKMSVINVGKNPTFNAKKTTVESHILDFSEDIYGKYVRVDFIQRLRGDFKFDGPDALKKQIAKDIDKTKKIILKGRLHF